MYENLVLPLSRGEFREGAMPHSLSIFIAWFPEVFYANEPLSYRPNETRPRPLGNFFVSWSRGLGNLLTLGHMHEVSLSCLFPAQAFISFGPGSVCPKYSGV